MIEVRELTKYYGESKAVGPLDFAIDKGEVIGLLGLNGAGKTTTLRMLSSELLPTSGVMRIDGADLVDEPEAVRARIGYLPDRPPLYGEMRVGEYLRFAADLHGVDSPDIARRVAEVAGTCALESHLDARIDTLSHGYKQRVGIAQAIVHKPALLLLDEPISGLDPKQIVGMRKLIRSLRGEHTIVVSSHILSEISETCDRVFVMHEGQIVSIGTEEELAEKMTPGQDVRIVVRGDAAEAVTLVEKVDGVKSAKKLDKVASEYRAMKDVAALHVNADKDVREAVCRALVKADFGLLEVTRAEPELEAIFLQLTGRNEEVDA